ncbi:hypothetical protein [Actinocatenispora comari]|jgi:hypothetical protein|uniref:Uncharacterized protein n=1 Tax=Actinocatenispora comari TaxID=2807577 RepID=A0A8J4AI66_9ACTN|nr:hypothetical protein [Actinocatenispora comari]GIL31648.1 hypothetical protein NUM_69020 [Actinocatenispora comari]
MSLHVDTTSLRQSVRTLDDRVSDLADAIGGLSDLGSPPLGTFPHAQDVIAWHDQAKQQVLDRLTQLQNALVALRDGNASIAEAYEAVERGTHHDVNRHTA